MTRVLFVSNGHGESAIAERIAREAAALSPVPLGLDHLALVGEPSGTGAFALVGPRRTLPSGGLVAMGNVGALGRDLRAGLLALAGAQLGFLRREGSRYDLALAVGDAYALLLTLAAKRRTYFVGTAKSVYVAPYGHGERVLLRRAARVFVRDEATAQDLLAHGVAAEAPGNVIVDLIDGAPPPPPEFGAARWIGLLPGSRASAYGDAVRLARVVRALSAQRPEFGALLSIAPNLEAAHFASALASAGWEIETPPNDAAAFRATSGAARLSAWTGPLGTLLQASTLVIGQAGTANEQAAAHGLPVVALDVEPKGLRRLGAGEGWYRMRQRRLLGDALALVSPQPEVAADQIATLLGDAPRLSRMRAAGIERMGPRGGARAIARAIVSGLR